MRCQHSSNMSAEISPAERLAVTLRYLATGNSQVSEKLAQYGNRFIMKNIYRFQLPYWKMYMYSVSNSKGNMRGYIARICKSTQQ